MHFARPSSLPRAAVGYFPASFALSPRLIDRSRRKILHTLHHQHKAAGRKTELDIQNGCNGNLLCNHGVVERNRISSLQSHGKALEIIIIIIFIPQVVKIPGDKNYKS